MKKANDRFYEGVIVGIVITIIALFLFMLFGGVFMGGWHHMWW